MDLIENGSACSEDGVSLTPKQDSRRIACNMRDVMNSTKKKERQHHRRKKENIKKFEPEITDISSIMNDTLNIVSPNVSVEESKDNKTPLKENSTQVSAGNQKNKKKKSRTKALCGDPTSNGSIKAHFSPKPKASDLVPEEVGNSNKKMNAFEVMMNARNKSIGSNTPGRDPEKPDDDVPADAKCPAAVKRKLMLEEWAEKKGASKRKIDDDARGEYIEFEMKKRAKRLKGMLANGKNSTSSQSSSFKDVPNGSKKSKIEQKMSSDLKNVDEPVKEIKEPKLKPKKQRASKGSTKKRVRRLSSIEIDDSQDTPISKTEDIEFVSKLSSPIKKRDSLLGYFSKVVSPNSSAKSEIKPTETATGKAEKVIETELEFNGNVSKTKSKRNSELNETTSSSPTPTSISSGRPKRSCAGKARYDYDLEVISNNSSDIEANSKRRSKRHIKVKTVAAEDVIQINSKNLIEIIDLDGSVDENISKNNGSLKEILGKKLAPVFVKAVPKPTPDPEKMRARQEFLMSGVPEKMRIEIAKQRQFELLYENEVEYFPKVSHVPQIDQIEVGDVSYLVNKKNRIFLKPDDDSPIVSKLRKLKVSILIEPSLKLSYVPLQKLPDIVNKRMFVKELKGKYDKFPTYRCYNQLREKYRSFSAKDTELDTQQLTESFVVTSSSRRHRHKRTDTRNPDEDKPPLSAPNGELLFTDKYKPMTSEQVLVNIAPVQELREFLSSWQIGRNSKFNDSYSDFELNDSSCNPNGLSNSVVLLGPSSSGKTNAVFALANELNFNVLEINAGMKRTGKKLLQELQESTQSHQVGKDNAKCNSLKLPLNGLKKRIEINDSNSSLDHSPSSSKLSLILVEDADIVFDQDAGFTEAIYQLSATSKRPVIIIASDPNCPHLLRLINQHSIAFAKPNVLNISKFLSILSLIENCPIDLDDIVSLYLYNRRNLRKTLLEMQFFIQSGGDRTRRKANNPHFVLTSPTRLPVESDNSKKDDQEDHLDGNNEKFSPKVYVHKTLFEFYTTCQNVSRIVPFPIDFNILWENLGDIFKISTNLRSSFSPKQIGRRVSPRKKNNLPKSTDELQTLTEFYENISTAACITRKGHIETDLCQPKLADEISHHLVEKSLKINLNAGVVSYNLFSKENDRTLLTSYISSHQLRPKRSVALDYEPCLRSICRSEKHRFHEERRGSRFYHYLRNTCNNLNSFSTDLFDNSCPILIDKKE